MKRRLLPTEVKMVEEILLQPEEDATVIAHTILRAINERRENERTYAVALFRADTLRFHSMWGPFPSKATADRAVANGETIVTSRQCVATVVPLIDPNEEEQ